MNKSHSSKNLNAIDCSNSQINKNNNHNNSSSKHNKLVRYGNNLYSENNTGENSTLLNQKKSNLDKEEKEIMVLRCENTEDFCVAKNKKKIKLKKKDTINNNRIISNSSKRNVDLFENSFVNCKKDLYEQELRNNNNNVINYSNKEEINADREINYFNVDHILEGDEIKFKQ